MLLIPPSPLMVHANSKNLSLFFILMISLLLSLPLEGKAKENISRAIEKKTCVLNELAKLSSEEKEALEILLYYPFKRAEFAYTLFGDKPMSFCILPPCVRTIDRHAPYVFFAHPENKPFLLGYKTWQRLQKDLTQQRYLLFFHNNTALIINKPLFEEHARKHPQLVQSAFGKEIDSQKLLQKFEKAPWETLEVLFKHSTLLGILLGYGEHNSRLFAQEYDLQLFGGRYLLKNEEQTKVCSHLGVLNETDPHLYCIIPVNFAADLHHSETNELKKKYGEMHQKMSAIYSQSNWLEITLQQLVVE